MVVFQVQFSLLFLSCTPYEYVFFSWRGMCFFHGEGRACSCAGRDTTSINMIVCCFRCTQRAKGASDASERCCRRGQCPNHVRRWAVGKGQTGPTTLGNLAIIGHSSRDAAVSSAYDGDRAALICDHRVLLGIQWGPRFRPKQLLPVL